MALVFLGFAGSRAGIAENRPIVPVTDAMLQKPAPAHWLMWRRTLDSWGFSPLDQVNSANQMFVFALP